MKGRNFWAVVAVVAVVIMIAALLDGKWGVVVIDLFVSFLAVGEALKIDEYNTGLRQLWGTDDLEKIYEIMRRTDR